MYIPRHISLTTVTVFLLLFCKTHSITEDDKNKIAHFVESILSCRNIPGITLSIVDRDGPIMEKGFGYANVERQEPVTPRTLFPIGSTTKAFTVTHLAQLMTDPAIKKFHWDSKLLDILGNGFELYDDHLTQQTTLRDILSHTTGVPDYFLPLIAIPPKNLTREELVHRLRYHKPKYPLRTKFLYNNYMYALAGYIAEKLSHSDWESLVRDQLLSPLGMTSTTFVKDLRENDSWAQSYVLKNGEFKHVDKWLIRQADKAGPAGSMLSNAEDMSKWILFHLKGGVTHNGEQLIDQKFLNETYMEMIPYPQVFANKAMSKPDFPISDTLVSYDMGWITNYYRGYRRIWHSGGISTYKALVWLYPDLGLGMFINCNGPPNSKASWGLYLILQYITDVIAGEKPWLNSTTGCSFPAPWKTPIDEDAMPGGDIADDTPSLGLEKYIGHYNHPGFGDIEVSLAKTPENHLKIFMAQFFEAILHYNKRENKFITKVTGKNAYIDFQIPVSFSSSLSNGDIDTLFIPLDVPFEQGEPMPFTRGSARKNYRRRELDVNGYSYKNPCSVSSSSKYEANVSYFISLCLIVTISADHFFKYSLL